MKKIVQIGAYAVLLVGTLVFGFLGKSAEMALAIVASAIALAFSDIERFSRIKGAGFEAELRDQIQAVIEKETEVPSGTEEQRLSPLAAEVDTNTMAVMSALNRAEYTWRYFGGVKKDSKLSSREVSRALDWLVEHGYARRSQGKHGTIWSLTEEGRHLEVIRDFEDISNA